jgi:zinc ribbon protein
MVVCPACGQENPEGFRFCGACAAPLAGGPPQREERKIRHRPAEAYARLRAGGDQRNQALAFYHSVGATRYIREAESMSRGLRRRRRPAGSVRPISPPQGQSAAAECGVDRSVGVDRQLLG